jgi:hypothetical protein
MLGEPHIFKAEPVRTNPAKEPPTKSGGRVTSRLISRDDSGTPEEQSPPMTRQGGKTGLHCPTCTCEQKRVYASPAEAQRAYRQRRK